MKEKNQERQLIVEGIKSFQSELIEFGVERIAIFGSIAKSRQNEMSDLDVLVNRISPQNKARLLVLLSQITDRPIELVEFEELEAPHKDEILGTRIDVFSLHEDESNH